MSHSKENVLVDSVKLRDYFKNQGLSLSAVALKMGRANNYVAHKLTIPVGKMNESDVMLFEHLFGIDIKSDFGVEEVSRKFNENEELTVIDVPKTVELSLSDKTLELLYETIKSAVIDGVREGLE